MTFNLVGVTFSEAYETTDFLKDQPGVYIIWKRVGSSNNYNFIDVGQSDEVKTRVENHDRADCWRRETNKQYYSVFYSNSNNEIDRVETDLRSEYNMPCGKR